MAPPPPQVCEACKFPSPGEDKFILMCWGSMLRHEKRYFIQIRKSFKAGELGVCDLDSPRFQFQRGLRDKAKGELQSQVP